MNTYYSCFIFNKHENIISHTDFIDDIERFTSIDNTNDEINIQLYDQEPEYRDWLLKLDGIELLTTKCKDKRQLKSNYKFKWIGNKTHYSNPFRGFELKKIQDYLYFSIVSKPYCYTVVLY